MQKRYELCWTLVVVAATCATSVAQEKPSASDPQIEVKVVKYDGLAEVIKQNRGKVVVVDFWGTFCPPCIREMPRLVQLQEKYGKTGFVAVLVSVDENAQKPEVQEKVKKVLRSRKATVTNLMLDEPTEVWQEKLGTKVVPCVYVFDRDGKWAKKYTDKNVDYNEIEKVVAQLLKKE